MRSFPVIASFAVVLLLGSGCETNLGHHYDNLRSDIEQAEKSSSEKQRYWQYQLHGRRLKIFHSAVEEVRIDETLRYSRRRVDAYLDLPQRSLVKRLFGKSVATGVLVFPLAFCLDVVMVCGNAVTSCFACWGDWQLDAYGPNFMYILGYMPVICAVNPFMDAPYMDGCDLRNPDGINHGSQRFVYGESEVYRVDHNNVFREREKLVKPERECTLKLNGLKRKLEIGDSGIAEIDLREWLKGKPLIPEFPLELSLKCGWRTVVELKLKSTQLLDGDELYLLRIARDEKTNLSARLKAVDLLRRQGVLAPDRAEAMKRSLLGCERFANSIKN